MDIGKLNGKSLERTLALAEFAQGVIDHLLSQGIRNAEEILTSKRFREGCWATEGLRDMASFYVPCGRSPVSESEAVEVVFSLGEHKDVIQLDSATWDPSCLPGSDVCYAVPIKGIPQERFCGGGLLDLYDKIGWKPCTLAQAHWVLSRCQMPTREKYHNSATGYRLNGGMNYLVLGECWRIDDKKTVQHLRENQVVSGSSRLSALHWEWYPEFEWSLDRERWEGYLSQRQELSLRADFDWHVLFRGPRLI